MAKPKIAAAGRRAGKSDWVEGLGRAGLVAKAILYAVVGILAIKVALGSGGQKADRDGALRAIAEQPFGKVLLGALALGLGGYAAWRLAQGILDRDDEGEDAKGIVKRLSAFARGGWYGTLCVLTVSKMVGSGSGGGGGGKEDKTTAGVLGLPLGRYLVFAAGAAFVGAGLFNGYRAVTCSFQKKLKRGEMSDAEEKAATVTGIVGHLARLVVFALIGAFLFKAAWQFDPKEAVGLDGALHEVAQAPYGEPLLFAVALGLISYALYCLVQARYRRV